MHFTLFSKGRSRRPSAAVSALAIGLAIVAPAAPVWAADEVMTVAVNTTTTFQNMDPTGNADAAAPSWLLPVYDTLFRAEGDGTYSPSLATEWQFNEDGSELVIHLREGVVFHDGTPFNAEAVKANLERSQTKEGSASSGRLAAVLSIEVLDDLTLRLVIEPSAAQPLIASLSGIAGMMASPAAFDNLAENAVGTGPFVLEGIGLTELVYRRNDAYWGHQPEYDVLNILRHDQTPAKSTYINALSTGGIDVWQINAGLTTQELALIATNPDLVVEESPGGLQQLVYMNRIDPPLDDVRVRQAISYAIDRQGLAMATNMTPSDQAMLPSSAFYNTEVADYYAFDPEKARELLAEAGYADGLTTTLYTHVRFQLGAQIVQAQLAEVGIEAELRPLDPPAFIAECFQQNKCPMLYSGLNAAADAVQVAQDVYMDNSFFNGNKSVPEEIAAHVDLLMQVAPDEDHITYGQDFLAEVVRQAPNLTVGFYKGYVIHQGDIEGVTEGMSPAGFFDYTALRRVE